MQEADREPDGGRALSQQDQQTLDLDAALEAINEMMSNTEPSPAEWVFWCNKYLPLVKRHGYQRWTVEFF